MRIFFWLKPKSGKCKKALNPGNLQNWKVGMFKP